jgi:hypothetical protein
MGRVTVTRTEGSTTIRVSTAVRDELQQLAAANDRSINEALEDLLKMRRKQEFFRNMREATDRLYADPQAWEEYQDEIALWDSTSSDGLEPYKDDEW